MKMRRTAWPLVLALLAVAPAFSGAVLFSKTYQFKAGTDLLITQEIDEGLRLDSVRIDMPTSEDGTLDPTSGSPTVDVAVSNLGKESRMFGIAVALFDDEGRLLGAGNGGPKMFPLRAERQGTYRVPLHGVNRESPKATRFTVSVETKR
jgi:hypothetical protein